MAREKSPAFQFYPRDFLADSNVMAMNNHEIGVYLKLMCCCWSDGHIPDSQKRIARVVGEPESVLAEMWEVLAPCFTPGQEKGTLVHPRLEREREAQAERRRKKAEAGRKGGKAKARAQQKRSSAKAEPEQGHGGGVASPSPSSASASASSTAMKEEQKPGSDEPGAAGPLADESKPADPMEAWSPKRRFMAEWMPLVKQAWVHDTPPEGAAGTYERRNGRPLTLDTEGSIGWQWAKDFEDDRFNGAELAVMVATLAVERAGGEPFSFTSFHSRAGRERLNELLAEAQKRCPTKDDDRMATPNALEQARRFIDAAKARQEGRAA